jgi:hypothetical protein
MTMNFVTFGNETINLDNVTYIEKGSWESSDGTSVPFIRFHFADDYYIGFSMLTWDKKLVPAYHRALTWLEAPQASTTTE